MKIEKNGLCWMLLLGGMLMIAGCLSHASQQADSRPAIRVGIVNLDRILPELPEYKQYSEAYQKERKELFRDVKIPKRPNQIPNISTQKRQEIEASVQKWDEKKRQFLENTLQGVKAASDQVVREKGIHIVLMSSPWLPVSQRMALDITTDVILTLREQGKTVH